MLHALPERLHKHHTRQEGCRNPASLAKWVFDQFSSPNVCHVCLHLEFRQPGNRAGCHTKRCIVLVAWKPHLWIGHTDVPLPCLCTPRIQLRPLTGSRAGAAGVQILHSGPQGLVAPDIQRIFFSQNRKTWTDAAQHSGSELMGRACRRHCRRSGAHRLAGCRSPQRLRQAAGYQQQAEQCPCLCCHLGQHAHPSPGATPVGSWSIADACALRCVQVCGWSAIALYCRMYL